MFSRRAIDINEGIRQFENHSGALLLDIREPKEYALGHIPGSINLPLQRLDEALTDSMLPEEIPALDTPLYIYCLSGTRSRLAAVMLAQLGYTDVRNIGGIDDWNGRIEESL